LVREVDRASFALAHALVRHALSAMDPRPAATWEFGVSPTGKPFVLGGGELRFSLSHTTGAAAVVVARDREVGVDIEPIDRPLHDLPRMLAVLSKAEQAELAELDEDARTRRFLEIWTLKEAYMKGIGQGLALPLDSFWFEESADGEVDVREANQPATKRNWRFWQDRPWPGYVVAVAAATTTTPMAWACRFWTPASD
jgi:4'-phosphopantetheinyl transferase